MNADQIRAIRLPLLPSATKLYGDPSSIEDYHGVVISHLVREIAAQLAEHTAHFAQQRELFLAEDRRRAAAEARAEENDRKADEMMEMQRKQFARMAGDDKDCLGGGTVIKIFSNKLPDKDAFGIVCEACGRVHPIPEQEALRIVAERETHPGTEKLQ